VLYAKQPTPKKESFEVKDDSIVDVEVVMHLIHVGNKQDL
jgi:hypothetical protein